MNCSKTLDLVYEYYGNEHDPQNSTPVLGQIQIMFHVFFCPNCAKEIKRLEEARKILKEDFFTLSPELEDSIMSKIAIDEETEPHYSIPGGISTRGWIIAGLVIFVSLATSFFGLDFQKVAGETGMSFLLPVGITVGIVLTVYGVFFIASHLKELASHLKELIERFDLL